MPVYNQYGLRTKSRQLASVGFTDRTVLHMNQQTNIVLRSPHLTYVQSGEVYQAVMPGSDHRIQTASAVASAIGTRYDVKVRAGVTEVIVAQGSVEVHNSKGRVIVKTDHETVVRPGQKPSPPKKVDASARTAWTNTVPTPKLPENLALDVNGGRVVDVSSQRPGAAASRVDDGRLDTSWESAPGAVTNQQVTLGFDGTKLFMVTGVLIDGSATGKASPQTDLKDFSIGWNNPQNTGNGFSTLVTGTLKQGGGLQWFPFSRPFPTRYLQLVAKNNHGSSDGISVAEIEAVGQPMPSSAHNFDFPTGIGIDPKGEIEVADAGFGFIQRLSTDGKLLATLGEPGQQPGQIDSANGLAVDPSGNIYVASQRGWVDKFSAAGKPLLRFGTTGTGQLANPHGIATDAQGNDYVADSNHNRIVKFSPSGQYITAFGATGSGSNKFSYGPFGVAVDGAGNIYATEPATELVWKFSPSGQVLARWGSGGRGSGQFSSPAGIALDTQGNIYVGDSQNNRIEKLGPDGTYLTSWSTPGATANAPDRPQYLVLDAQGNVYVTTASYGSVVQKYSPGGKLLATWR
jgi:sugar lactone lactonase YvrE